MENVMDIKKFIENFADQFDDTQLSEFSENTRFKELDEWSSLTALAILNMINKKYGILLKNNEMQTKNTIKELFDLMQSKL
jgi:acyl carrier protein